MASIIVTRVIKRRMTLKYNDKKCSIICISNAFLQKKSIPPPNYDK